VNPRFFDRFIRQPLRAALLRALRWTEPRDTDGAPRRRGAALFQREVRIPTGLVAVATWLMLFGVMFLELGPGWDRALALLLFTGILMALFIFYFRHDHPEILHDEEAVALLGVLAVGSVWLVEIWREMAQLYPWISPLGIPLAATPLLTALLLQPRLAIILAVVLSLLFGVIDRFSLAGVLVTFFGGLTAVARALTIRTRRDVTRAGLWVGLAEGLTVVILALLRDWPMDRLVFELTWVFVGGILSAIAALSLLPYLESFFSRITNIKLLELADVNHPLLKRMSLEAPGTYHHSLIMASLAQAAAESIGANGLLCRVGAYFHDIGKMAKPEYFVENQGALGNPHDPLPPNMSRLVIQSHVKDGVAMAQQYGLDRAITDFITMHHGTSTIEYFYRRAIEQSEDLSPVDEDEYRYPGPKPYSKETAILMLADSVEASVRTLDEPTHQRLQDQVQKIISTKMGDGQFDDVPLTLSDLNKISESFVNTLTGIYHSRIRYPDAARDAETEDVSSSPDRR
jgi:putative nucleotidyltransferase with HDIG domain